MCKAEDQTQNYDTEKNILHTIRLFVTLFLLSGRHKTKTRKSRLKYEVKYNLYF